MKTYAILGGTAGIGFALAQRLLARGDGVLVGGRSQASVDRAAERLGGAARVRRVDTEEDGAVARFLKDERDLAGLFVLGSPRATPSFRDGARADVEALFAIKFWGQYWAVHAALPHLAGDASVVLMSGAASVRPLGSSAYTACNAAIEGLARGLAVELSPIRVNCLSPGIIDSDLWRGRPDAQRETAYAGWQGLSVVGRPGTVEEAAGAALFLLDNGNMTGSTIYVDGGFALR